MGIELSLRDGDMIDRAERQLAHAIAAITDDWPEAQALARKDRADAIANAVSDGLQDRRLALQVVSSINRSIERLPA